MIALMDLRAGNYIHPAKAGGEPGPDNSRYLRVIAIHLVEKQVQAKADGETTLYTLNHDAIFPCAFDDLARLTGGLSFGEHALLLQEQMASIVHENGSVIPLPHIRFVHQFQNLIRSLTGDELPFNITSSAG
jgi:hypothetical protein